MLSRNWWWGSCVCHFDTGGDDDNYGDDDNDDHGSDDTDRFWKKRVSWKCERTDSVTVMVKTVMVMIVAEEMKFTTKSVPIPRLQRKSSSRQLLVMELKMWSSWKYCSCDFDWAENVLKTDLVRTMIMTSTQPAPKHYKYKNCGLRIAIKTMQNWWRTKKPNMWVRVEQIAGRKTWTVAGCKRPELPPGRRWFLDCMSTPGFIEG